MPKSATRKQSSRACSSASKIGEEKVKRPANCWILFRAEVTRAGVHVFPNMPLNVLYEVIELPSVEELMRGERDTIEGGSRGWGDVALVWWEMMSEAEKDNWRQKGRAVVVAHKVRHPGYKYRPKKRQQSKASGSSLPSMTPPATTNPSLPASSRIQNSPTPPLQHPARIFTIDDNYDQSLPPGRPVSQEHFLPQPDHRRQAFLPPPSHAANGHQASHSCGPLDRRILCRRSSLTVPSKPRRSKWQTSMETYAGNNSYQGLGLIA